MARPEVSDIERAKVLFAGRDTAEQERIVRRIGLETETADAVIGYLRTMHPDRYAALMTLTGWEQ